MTATPALVLVHSPLVGPATWEAVASVFVRRGVRARVPSLVEAASASPFAERCATAVAEALRGEEAVALVGHSGAGPLLPVIAARVRQAGTRVAACVFADASLPAPGRSRLASFHPSLRGHLAAMADDGVLPPWSAWFGPGSLDALVPDPEVRAAFVAELRPVPVGLLEEPLPAVALPPDVPCAYLRLSDAYVAEEADAARLGWPVASRGDNHLLPLVDPEGTADALLDVLGRVGLVP